MRILVIEDDRHLAASVRRGLQADGFAVDVALDGNDGLWQARECAYDAIVCDILLPGISGFRVCDELRKAGNWTPLLMLTAKSGELDEAEALDTGADDYLRKPFAFVVLLARLRALLRRGHGAPAVLEAGDLVLDPAARTCTRLGRPVDLTVKELAVLECLMRRSGDVVSKPEILAQVWDLYDDRDLNIVEVYVSAVRRKVGGHRITTVRGSGYRLEDHDA